MDKYTITFEDGWWNVCLDGDVVDGFDCPVDAGQYMMHLLRSSYE